MEIVKCLVWNSDISVIPTDLSVQACLLVISNSTLVLSLVIRIYDPCRAVLILL